jgi:hypothetical protein
MASALTVFMGNTSVSEAPVSTPGKGGRKQTTGAKETALRAAAALRENEVASAAYMTLSWLVGLAPKAIGPHTRLQSMHVKALATVFNLPDFPAVVERLAGCGFDVCDALFSQRNTGAFEIPDPYELGDFFGINAHATLVRISKAKCDELTGTQEWLCVCVCVCVHKFCPEMVSS